MAEYTRSPASGSTPATGYSTDTSSASSQGGAATRIVDRVKERATAQLSTQKDKATDGLGTVAQAVRQTTQHLREQQHDTVAGYVEQAANQIERLSERLKNKDVTELLNDAQRLARSQPALFVGGAFALGLAGARFLKSSASSDDYGYDRGAGSYGSTSGAYGTGSAGYGTGSGSYGTNSGAYGTGAASGDITGGAAGGLGNTGSSASSAGSSTRNSNPSSPSSSGTTDSSYGSTAGRDDRERF